MRNYNTIEYLGILEQLNNPDFNPLEFDGYLKEAGSNAFTLSPQKWQKTTNAMDQKERMMELRKLARTQLMSLEKLRCSGIKRLEGKK